ncbi:MAG: hypothetical protein ABR584_00145 [Candidatus Baltobacteraceae bacterium]
MMDESELAAVVLALRQLQAKAQEDMPQITAWQLAAKYPELDFDEVRALSHGGYRVP